jgi:hypothetical protein
MAYATDSWPILARLASIPYSSRAYAGQDGPDATLDQHRQAVLAAC